jgi:hypothetical protein
MNARQREERRYWARIYSALRRERRVKAAQGIVWQDALRQKR